MCREQQREEEGYGLRELEEEQPEKKAITTQDT